VPGLDWETLRRCKEGEPSPLREFVTGRPTRGQIIRQFVAELGDRLSVGVWTYHNSATDRWKIGWEELEPGNPSKAQILDAITADKVVAQFCADIVLSTQAGAVITWARDMLQPGAACVLDTETVDLHAPVCEIAVIDAATDETLLSSLVNPGVPISHSAFSTHGIADIDVANAPTWPDVLPELLRITMNRKILAYNADYDIRNIRAECRRYHLHPGHLGGRRNWDCVMRRRSDWLRTRRWVPLGGSHRALDDCLGALDILRGLAAPPRGCDMDRWGGMGSPEEAAAHPANREDPTAFLTQLVSAAHRGVDPGV
jgi:DNA polymerase III epsilon subunit-like protein